MLAALIEHLRSTGTGAAKLAALEGIKADTAAEFLAACSAKLPGGTVSKVAAWLAEHGAEALPVAEVPQAMEEKPQPETTSRRTHRGK